MGVARISLQTATDINSCTAIDKWVRLYVCLQTANDPDKLVWPTKEVELQIFEYSRLWHQDLDIV